MASWLVCPCCGRRQHPTMHVQIVEPPAREGLKSPDRGPRRNLIILLLALSVFGLPLAYRMCQQDAAAYAINGRIRYQYTYQCNQCGHVWSRIRDEELPLLLPEQKAARSDRGVSVDPTQRSV